MGSKADKAKKVAEMIVKGAAIVTAIAGAVSATKKGNS